MRPDMGGGVAKRRVVYCIVPRDLASVLHEPLREHFHEDRSVEVVIEQRWRDRRRGCDRRKADKGEPAKGERRLIRNKSGRRIGERRAAQVPVSPPPLPAIAEPYLDQLLFVERVMASDEHDEDLITGRLVTRLQAGDLDAFNELYLRYFDRVYGYLRVALRDPHEAEDVTQQVFINVFEALPRYERRRQPFRAWLFRIVRNRGIDALRRRQRLEPADPVELQRRRDEAAVDEESATRALEWLSDAEILVLIERLPQAQRQVVVLRYMLDLSTVEIAQVLDRSPAAVRQLQHRALRFLEERLEALGRTPEDRHGKRMPMMRAKRVRAVGGATT
jgi:RNA polymerase sigma-70 factor, ECF subfamily